MSDCVICGGPVPPPKRSWDKPRKTCSLRCSRTVASHAAAERRRHEGLPAAHINYQRGIAVQYRAHIKRGYALKPCCICGSLFQSPQPKAVACTDECRKAYQAWQARRTNYGRTLSCPVCGVQHSPIYGRKAVCSDACGRTHDANMRKQNNSNGWYSRRPLRSLMAQWDNRCGYCHKPIRAYSGKWQENAHRDHFIAQANGGTKRISNMVISCGECNVSKADHGPHQWMHDTFPDDWIPRLAYVRGKMTEKG